jgi:hypothetical protein
MRRVTIGSTVFVLSFAFVFAFVLNAIPPAPNLHANHRIGNMSPYSVQHTMSHLFCVYWLMALSPALELVQLAL